MKKILLGLLVTGAVGGVAFAATNAFFSDTETSTDNQFTAGAIDLKIDNTSYYNGIASTGTSWLSKDLVDEKFFNFSDLKPGDWGEDTISILVNNNDSWVCADVKLTDNNDNGCSEPELEATSDPNCSLTPTPAPANDGELAGHINFIWWADDSDNVLETDETVLPGGNLGQLGVGITAEVALVDPANNLWGPTPSPFPASTTKYLAKAWCFGTITPLALPQNGAGSWTPATDNNNSGGVTSEDGGFTCDGSVVTGNAVQTDKLMADISFRAVQSRNNPSFSCATP